MEQPIIYILDIATVEKNETDFDLVLTQDERERKGRYRQRNDALRFLGGRYLIHRFIKGKLLIEKHGKPYVEGGQNFSLSHAKNKIVLGIASEGRIGVDIEGGREKEIKSLVDFTCTDSEKQCIESDSDFYRAWTRKEALSKLIGLGLGIPPKSIETSKSTESITYENKEYYAKSLQIGDLWLSICTEFPLGEPHLEYVD